MAEPRKMLVPVCGVKWLLGLSKTPCGSAGLRALQGEEERRRMQGKRAPPGGAAAGSSSSLLDALSAQNVISCSYLAHPKNAPHVGGLGGEGGVGVGGCGTPGLKGSRN